jgi:hypothetical protein
MGITHADVVRAVSGSPAHTTTAAINFRSLVGNRRFNFARRHGHLVIFPTFASVVMNPYPHMSQVWNSYRRQPVVSEVRCNIRCSRPNKYLAVVTSPYSRVVSIAALISATILTFPAASACSVRASG